MKGRGYITQMSFDGYGVLELQKPVHVPFTVIGDLVEVRKTFRRFGRYIAREFEVIEESHLRQRPRCSHFKRCGGCFWQHIKYREQLNLKKELFERVTGIEAPIKGSPKIWGFRNISNFIVSTRGIGFKQRESQNVVGVKECPIFSNKTLDFLLTLKKFMKEERLMPWDSKQKFGEIHYFSVREGKSTGDVMVNMIAHIKEVPSSFIDYFDFADSIYWSFKDDSRDEPRGIPLLIGGSPYIREKIGDTIYLIHPNSFFQTNSYATHLLLKAVLDFIEGESVFDLYAGVGTFGVYLAKRGLKVEGIEINSPAVEIANKNAEINGVDARFSVGNVKDVEIGDYDTIIVDPPRKGLKEAVKLITKSKVNNLIYISCNPQAFVRDYEHLKENYEIENAVLIDMFPHTSHIEAVIKLKLK